MGRGDAGVGDGCSRRGSWNRQHSHRRERRRKGMGGGKTKLRLLRLRWLLGEKGKGGRGDSAAVLVLVHGRRVCLCRKAGREEG